MTVQQLKAVLVHLVHLENVITLQVKIVAAMAFVRQVMEVVVHAHQTASFSQTAMKFLIIDPMVLLVDFIPRLLVALCSMCQ